MPASVFDLFSIGVGPSSSHTLGPMRAAAAFARDVEERGALSQCARVVCELYGSLALTGKGHCTDKAILAGLSGRCADEIASGELGAIESTVRAERFLVLGGKQRCAFSCDTDLVFRTQDLLPGHSNGMRFLALDSSGSTLCESVYYSVGGGFVVDGEGKALGVDGAEPEVSFPYRSAESLMGAADAGGIRIADVVWQWECSLRSETEIQSKMLRIASVMDECIEAGLATDGELPGGLRVRRRAPGFYRRLQQESCAGGGEAMDWLSVYAIAVNEENAAMGRVVTAPTNGAAGVIPSVLRYYLRHVAHEASAEKKDRDAVEFLMVAGAIGILYKEGASLSAAEVGCQGEVGVACSMAAGALASVMGGSNAQVENAAEIGMEHNLGLTCDPIGGLVQIPCIERNSMGAVKAVNAARLALHSDGRHVVSLDRVIATMRKTGEDMVSQYKETSLGGLAIAVTLPEC